MSPYEQQEESLSYRRDRIKPGIVHFGMGNFARAHTAFYLHRALERAREDERQGMIAIALRPSGEAVQRGEAFRKHKGLYHLVTAAPDGHLTPCLIGAWLDYVIAPHEPQKVLDYLTAPDLSLVTLTITEGGYGLDSTAMTHDGQKAEQKAQGQKDAGQWVPQSAFGYIVAACAIRRQKMLGGFGVWSCDNQQHNGDLARKAVLFLAEKEDPSLAQWCADHLTFPNSMVDRITPKLSAEEETGLVQRVQKETGQAVIWPVLSEAFHQWVVEERSISPALRPLCRLLKEAGVVFSDNVAGYEQVKMRLLNAGHGMLCYISLLMGYRIKDEAMQNEPDLRLLLGQFWQKDVVPHLRPPEGNAPEDVDLAQYCALLAERFANLSIADQTARVASDGGSKIPAFWGPTVRAVLIHGGSLERIGFGLAAYIIMRRAALANALPDTPKEPTYGEAEMALLAEDMPDLLQKLPAFHVWQDLEHTRLDAAIAYWRNAIEKQGIRQALKAVLKQDTP